MSNIHPYLGVPKLVYKPKPPSTDDSDAFCDDMDGTPPEKSQDYVFYECYDLSGTFHYEKLTHPTTLPTKPSSQVINVHRNYPEYVHRIILYFSFKKPST